MTRESVTPAFHRSETSFISSKGVGIFSCLECYCLSCDRHLSRLQQPSMTRPHRFTGSSLSLVQQTLVCCSVRKRRTEDLGYTQQSPYPPSRFPCVRCSLVSCSLKILNGKLQKETLCKFYIACRSEYCDDVLNCPAPSCPARAPARCPASPRWTRSPPVSPSVAVSVIRPTVTVSQCFPPSRPRLSVECRALGRQ